MAYRFTFDLSRVRKNFAKEITVISLKKNFHKRVSTLAKRIVKTLNLV